jgi:hypothetical protein
MCSSPMANIVARCLFVFGVAQIHGFEDQFSDTVEAKREGKRQAANFGASLVKQKFVQITVCVFKYFVRTSSRGGFK